MTIKIKAFGTVLITRQDAKDILQAIGVPKDTPVLNFAGVSVANHAFADELGKGLASNFDISKIKLTGANLYVKNSVEAGFSTAAGH
ncbi:MAG TPA: hypothetical protein VFA76_16675 [Terriglobales bacterium]|nr:hypothetical protein [Terriglobales bacterium]